MITNRVFLALCLAAMACSATGCANLVTKQADQNATFPESLHSCRSLQPGRATRKFQLPPTHPQIAECLSRHGWNPEGTRIPVGSEPQAR
jgi:hypothetical protein